MHFYLSSCVDYNNNTTEMKCPMCAFEAVTTLEGLLHELIGRYAHTLMENKCKTCMMSCFADLAKRVVPEALGFIASAIRLFPPDNTGSFTIPALQTTYKQSTVLSITT